MVAQLFNLACSLVVAWLTMNLAGMLFGSVIVARIALLLLAVYPNSIGYVPLLSQRYTTRCYCWQDVGC